MTKLGEYDDGYSDKPAETDNRAALYVMGAIDEFRSLGIIENIGGDRPLADHAQRKLYRQLKKDGYKPTVEEAETIVSKCVCADDQACFLTLLRGVIEKGWKHMKRLHEEAKVEDERGPRPEDYGMPPGWTLL